jgi:hypothetical protein
MDGKLLVMRKLLVVMGLFALAACTAPTLPSVTPQASAAVGSDACHVNGVTYCALNANVTQATIHSTICVKGWTTTVRPPTSYTEPLKKQMIALYANQHVGDANWTLGNTELDHRVPLELGGAPKDPNNLSPEEHPGTVGSVTKDGDENAFNKSVCNGSQTLAQAQAAFVGKWLAVYPAYKDGKTSG